MNHHNNNNLWWVGVTTEPRHQIENYNCVNPPGPASCTASPSCSIKGTTGTENTVQADISSFMFPGPAGSRTNYGGSNPVELGINSNSSNPDTAQNQYLLYQTASKLHEFITENLIGTYDEDQQKSFLTVGDPNNSKNMYENCFLTDDEYNSKMRITQAPWRNSNESSSSNQCSGYNRYNVMATQDGIPTPPILWKPSPTVVCLIKWKLEDKSNPSPYSAIINNEPWSIEQIFLVPDTCTNQNPTSLKCKKAQEYNKSFGACNSAIMWAAPNSPGYPSPV
jgi:hypothetical protein